MLDSHADAPQLAEVFGPERHAGGFGVHDRIESAAERHIGPNLARAEPDGHRGLQDEGWNVDEAHSLDSRSIAVTPYVGARADLPCRRIEHDGVAVAGDDQPAFDRHRHDSDDAVAAHRAVALVVHEEHARVRVRMFRLGQQRAVHVRVAAGLQHQRGSQVVAVGPHPLTPLEHRPALHARKAVHDEPERLASGVRVDGADLMVHWFRVQGSGFRVQGSRFNAFNLSCNRQLIIPNQNHEPEPELLNLEP